MMCGHAKELIAASWTGELSDQDEAALRHHLSACPECGAATAHLSALWERLSDLPAPEPSVALGTRWNATLQSLGAQHSPARTDNAWRFSFSALWPQRPAWQVAVAAACLALGLIAGFSLRPGVNPSEVAKLREEVAGARELAALSLLRQQSATDRLRGVDYSVSMPTLEPQVVSALIQAVSHDANVNVRLAAIDALTKVSGNPAVRQSLTGSIAHQDSPMVQAALIDYILDTHDRQAIGTLRQLTERSDLNPVVRQRADKAVRQLNEYR